MISRLGSVFASDNVRATQPRDKKPKGYGDNRSYQKRLQDALNTFETREIRDRIHLQNFWCSFIKQPRKCDVPVIEAYVVLNLHHPDVFRAKVWTLKDDLYKNIDVDHINMSAAEMSQRMGQIPDFVTQARYDIGPVEKFAIAALPTL